MGRIRRLLSKVGLAAPQTRMGRWVYPMPAQRALYFAVPKVACTTWLRICCRTQGVELGDLPPDAWFDAIPRVDRRDLRRFAGWRGFGFVRGDDGKEVFFHRSRLGSTDYDSLSEGDVVEYVVQEGPRGARAENVRAVSEASPAAEAQ